MKPGTCPNCGANVPRSARACPGCGADERTGWSEDAEADRLDLPPDPDAFDHEAWQRSEFGETVAGRAGRGEGRRRFWWWVAVAVLATLVLGWLAR